MLHLCYITYHFISLDSDLVGVGVGFKWHYKQLSPISFFCIPSVFVNLLTAAKTWTKQIDVEFKFLLTYDDLSWVKLYLNSSAAVRFVAQCVVVPVKMHQPWILFRFLSFWLLQFSQQMSPEASHFDWTCVTVALWLLSLLAE